MSDAGECPRCHAHLAALAAYCAHCALIIPPKTLISVPAEILDLAKRHRGLMGVFGIFLVIHLLFAIPMGAGFVNIGVGAMAWLILVIALMLCVLRLSDALHFGVIGSVLMSFVCLIPVANLFVVLWLSRRAIIELRSVGISAGVTGVKLADDDVIAYVHSCRSCGYDLRGLTSLKCPECGVAFSPPLASVPMNP